MLIDVEEGGNYGVSTTQLITLLTHDDDNPNSEEIIATIKLGDDGDGFVEFNEFEDIVMFFKKSLEEMQLKC